MFKRRRRRWKWPAQYPYDPRYWSSPELRRAHTWFINDSGLFSRAAHPQPPRRPTAMAQDIAGAPRDPNSSGRPGGFVVPVVLLDTLVGPYAANAMILGVLVGALGSKIGGGRSRLAKRGAATHEY